ncbi:MAG: hypothetical protein ACSLFQ_15945 [Thermoanaerobaculia bacterium]
MNPIRSVEDKLRGEYFELLPEMRRVAEQLEIQVRHSLLPITLDLSKYEFVQVQARMKDCQSAVGALLRRQEGRIFDPDKFSTYTLLSLNDLVGVRVMAFPPSRLEHVESLLLPGFSGWTKDPVPPARKGEPDLATKLYGLSTASGRVRAELQIVSMLLGQFLQVEHSAIYKPAPKLQDAVRDPKLMEKRNEVFRALREFEEAFELAIRQVTER